MLLLRYEFPLPNLAIRRRAFPIHFRHRDSAGIRTVTLTFRAKRLGATAISAAPRFLTRKPQPGVRVLTYHSVGHQVDGDINDIYNMSPSEFEEHVATILRFSAAHSLPIVPFGSETQSGIAITFDDGYVDVLQTVAPIISRHPIPFHVFITPTKLTSGDSRYLTTQQLKEVALNPLVSIGAHGFEHRPLTNMSAHDAEHDLRHSRETLGEILQREVETMSYPFGMVDQSVRDAAARAGFTKAACSKWGFNHPDTDLLMLRRIDMWARDGRSTVVDKLFGRWNWFARLT